MTFQGDTIISDSLLAMIEIYIAQKGFLCEPKECYDYWERKGWKTNKGRSIDRLEDAVTLYNSLAVQKFIKQNQKTLGITKLSKKAKKQAKRKIRKELLNGNKHLANQLILENFSLKPSESKEKSRIDYAKQLEDARWKAFRTFVFAVRGKKCELCGSTHILQVHHPKYRNGRLAWEYTCNEVQVLCKSCHEKVHNITH